MKAVFHKLLIQNALREHRNSCKACRNSHMKAVPVHKDKIAQSIKSTGRQVPMSWLSSSSMRTPWAELASLLKRSIVGASRNACEGSQSLLRMFFNNMKKTKYKTYGAKIYLEYVTRRCTFKFEVRNAAIQVLYSKNVISRYLCRQWAVTLSLSQTTVALQAIWLKNRSSKYCLNLILLTMSCSNGKQIPFFLFWKASIWWLTDLFKAFIWDSYFKQATRMMPYRKQVFGDCRVAC